MVKVRKQLPRRVVSTVRAETPVVSELWGATQQPWGRSLVYIKKSGEGIYDTPWGRSLEKQLRIPTIDVTLHIN